MKIKISGLIFLIIVNMALSGLESYPIASLVGAVPAAEPITDLRVIHDLKGGAYVLSVAGGVLNVIRGTAGGSLGPYEIRDLPETALKARNLQINAAGPFRYAAFIDGEGPAENIRVLGLDLRGELVYYPVPETKTAGPLSEFIITSSYNGSAELYLLGDGRLSCVSGIGRGDKLKVYQSLSLNGETVEAFGIIGDIRQGPRYGWYRVRSGENREIITFSVSEYGVLKRERLGIYPGDVKVFSGMTFDRTIILTLIHENHVEVFRETGSGFLRNSFNAPVPVKQYYAPDQIGGNMGILTGGSGGEEQVYGVFYENTGAPVLKEWLTIRDGSVMDMIYAGNKQLVILYEDGAGWHSALVDLSGSFLGEKPIRGPESGARLLYSGGLGEVSLCMVDKKDGGRLMFYGLTGGGDWELLRQMPIPADIWEPGIKGEDLPALNPFYFNSAVVPLASPAVLALCEAETGTWQLIAGIKRHWSRRINDRILLAVYTGREIALYRMEG
jgi:hypothetical protein